MSDDVKILRSAAWHGQAVAVGRPHGTGAGHAAAGPVATPSPPLLAEAAVSAPRRTAAQGLAAGPHRAAMPSAAAPDSVPAAEVPAQDLARLQAQWKEEGRRAGHAQGLAEGRRMVDEDIQARAEVLARDVVAEQVREAMEQVRASEKAQRHSEAQERQSAAQEVARRAERLEQLAGQLAQEWTRFLQGAEDDMLDIVFEAVCRITGDRAVTRDGARELLVLSLEAWHGRHPLNVHLHPDDAAMLKEDALTLEALASRGFDAGRESVRWVADPEVRMGGCLLRSAEGALDARLERQLQALASRLAETRAGRRQQQVAGANGSVGGEVA
ncbi:FliH/SctL family protein [Paracidovorax avenae]|uniref:FliH/SctL family protein n=1 Tax=Paracidovorax avenae TaxID=80867 RepID=UPI001314C888|nr:FliH/SctL family protein [Paracidovorax avenae]